MLCHFILFSLLALPLAQVLSPTGRQIPLSVLPNSAPLSIFELSNNVFLGPNIRVHIPTETFHVDLLTPREPLVRELNGKDEIYRHRIKTHIRYGKELTFVYSDGNLIIVFGKKVSLVPLQGFPNVFINTFSDVVLKMEENNPLVIDPIDEEMPVVQDNGTDSSTRFFSSSRQSARCANGGRFKYEIAVAYDNTFCALFGNDEFQASAMIQALVDASNVAYNRDTCITLSLVHIEAHCNDPADPYASLKNFSPLECPGLPSSFSCTASRSILYKFRNYWLLNRGSVRRDAAFLSTGFGVPTNVVGIAFTSSSCTSSAFGWTNGLRLKTFAHEIGHTLSGSHRTEDGIMKQGTTSKFAFLPETVGEFTSFIDNDSRSGCITTEAPICDADNGSCSKRTCPHGKCISGPTVNPPLVPCIPIRGNYYCIREVATNFFVGVSCPNDGFDFTIAKDATDPRVLCCARESARINRRVISTLSGFSGLRVGSTLYSTYITNPADVKEKTFLNTKVVSCSRPRESPSLTPKPSSRSSALTCASTMLPGRTFKCIKKHLGVFGRSKVGRVRLHVQQAGGIIVVKVTARSKTMIIPSGSRLRVSSTERSKPPFIPTSSVTRTSRVLSVTLKPFSIRVEAGRKQCCGMKLYISATIKVQKKGSRKMGVLRRTFAYRITCKQVCKKANGKSVGVVMPFSSSVSCPFCMK